MIKVFIGYDTREIAAFHVLAQSIINHASEPVAIIPLVQAQLRSMGIYRRETGASESTEFSLTRFLVPYLSDYRGTSIFMDCDMLCQADICELAKRVEIGMAVAVCQHEYHPKTKTKMGGKAQSSYPRKNWSSLMVFSNSHFHCRSLTPDFVSRAEASHLQQLRWSDRIGSLPIEWNWLAGEYVENPEAKILHYTLGGPWFDPWYKALKAIE